MNKHAVTILCLFLALTLYAIGLALPGTLFLILGAIAEGTFWIRLFRGTRRGRRSS